MIRSRLSLAVAASLALLDARPLVSQVTRPGSVTARQIATLNSFRADYVTSMLDGRAELLSGYYADSIRLMTEFQKTIVGKANAAAYNVAFTARFHVQRYGREEREVIDLGPRLVELGLFTMTLAPKRSGPSRELAGKYLNIWEKSPDGKLSLITDAWNYLDQVDIADQLRFVSVPVVDMALQPHVPVKDDISVELAARNRLLETVVSQHDAKVWSLFYADDAVCLPSGAPVVAGRKALDEFLENHVRHLPVFEKLDIRNDRIDLTGSYVIEYATHIANWRDGDASGVSTGKDIRIWRREAGGALKLFRTIGMYD